MHLYSFQNLFSEFLYKKFRTNFSLSCFLINQKFFLLIISHSPIYVTFISTFLHLKNLNFNFIYSFFISLCFFIFFEIIYILYFQRPFEKKTDNSFVKSNFLNWSFRPTNFSELFTSCCLSLFLWFYLFSMWLL